MTTTSSLRLCCNTLNKLLSSSIPQALPLEADKVADFPGIITKMWNVLNDPDALEALAHELDKAVIELQEKAQASDIDLSDPERAEIYKPAESRFLRTLVMQGPEMPISMLNTLLLEHMAFVTDFTKLKTKDVVLRAQRLRVLVGLAGR